MLPFKAGEIATCFYPFSLFKFHAHRTNIASASDKHSMRIGLIPVGSVLGSVLKSVSDDLFSPNSFPYILSTTPVYNFQSILLQISEFNFLCGNGAHSFRECEICLFKSHCYQAVFPPGIYLRCSLPPSHPSAMLCELAEDIIPRPRRGRDGSRRQKYISN